MKKQESNSLWYFIVYKPYGVICQFSASDNNQPTLGSLYLFPKDVYPVGRLDTDSEGLLIITNDKRLNHRLLNPQYAHKRTYWVQVEGMVSPDAIEKLSTGVQITINGNRYNTLPAFAQILPHAPNLPDREPPIRYRANIPTSWISLTLTEGKNRQVRKMTAAVGCPTLRLVRQSIEELTLVDMQPGDVKQLSGERVYKLLFANTAQK